MRVSNFGDVLYFDSLPNGLMELKIENDGRHRPSQATIEAYPKAVSLLDVSSSLKYLEISGIEGLGFEDELVYVGFWEIPKVCRRKSITLK